MATGLYPVVPHLGTALSRRRAGRRGPPGQMRALFTEWAVSVALSAARPVGHLGLPVSLRRRRGPRPVILLHGYGMSRACFLPLARRLARSGLGPLIGFEYWTPGSVARAARELGAFIETVCDETGSEQVDLVGHSMGGVVARYYVTLLGGSPRVRNLITIGSPHRGTDASAVSLGRPRKELITGSPLAQRLESAQLPADTRFTVIWSRNDVLVPGAGRARVEGSEELSFDELGHVTLLVSPRVGRAVVERLRE